MQVSHRYGCTEQSGTTGYVDLCRVDYRPPNLWNPNTMVDIDLCPTAKYFWYSIMPAGYAGVLFDWLNSIHVVKSSYREYCRKCFDPLIKQTTALIWYYRRKLPLLAVKCLVIHNANLLWATNQIHTQAGSKKDRVLYICYMLVWHTMRLRVWALGCPKMFEVPETNAAPAVSPR